MPRILIIDDDESICHVLSRTVKRMGCDVDSVGTLSAGVGMARARAFDVVFLDVKLPDGNGLSILGELTAMSAKPEVIIVTGMGDPAGAELAIKNGAWDYIEKSYSVEQISLTLKRALDYRRARSKEGGNTLWSVLSRDRIIGESPALTRVLDTVAQFAGADSNVLITGETGTGKELFAHAIHQNSGRSDGPFVTVDCATLPESIAQSILFGHRKGAFTGAEKDQLGLILQANGGTLFLDEVGELPPSVQKNFLRVLQERSIRSLGDREERSVDFRLVAATNRNLDDMTAAGTFRSDLLYRLRASHIHLPPLRERAGDIRLLTEHFLEAMCARAGTAPKTCSTDFLETLEAYEWPGNVRELIHTLEHAFTAAKLDQYLFPQHLPPGLRAKVARARIAGPTHSAARTQEDANGGAGDVTPSQPLQEYRDAVLARAESRYLQNLMTSTNGNVREVIRLSGLSQSRLYALLKKYGITTH
ncbi:sigma-54-dependent transcriptional regulator [Nitratidesulfovibrio liaohensis]|uniref:sigma-54-dependent transcriptional regulator n=1 Tax=Nitratidesulfovibrio liaohensis TaxID=2604158 RepID=UPI0014229C80|nr:sigma-54 dependent transcriptional regulator [Nitratidesulfovibrio liaohensis]NHZ45276.1 sigma-54-dependent Fis family transcriptional regulator [Nitratidesulfovibrio liaohensis]